MQTDDNQAPDHPEHRYRHGSALLVPWSVARVELVNMVSTSGCHVAHRFEERALYVSSVPLLLWRLARKLEWGRGLKIWTAALKKYGEGMIIRVPRKGNPTNLLKLHEHGQLFSEGKFQLLTRKACSLVDKGIRYFFHDAFKSVYYGLGFCCWL